MQKKRITIAGAVMLMMLSAVAAGNITFFMVGDFYNQKLGNLSALESKYKKIDEISGVIDQYYIGDDYDETKLIEGAAAGYVSALGDKWSGYYTAEECARISEQDQNTYVGIGVSLSQEEGSEYEIISVTEGSPADQAGIQIFDVMTKVNGVSIKEFKSYEDVVAQVRGEAGTQVSISVLRNGQELNFTLTRADIHSEYVETRVLPNDIGLVRISSFYSNVDKEFETKLSALLKQGVRALIFDVRFNPGGYVDVLSHMLDKLLPEGTVISITDKAGATMEYTSDKECVTLPMAVITNQYSISAAEFFAAALQEYGVATVVGDVTSGKGYAQKMIPLSDGSGVNISTARYYTPKGVSLAGKGVTPDVPVSLSEEALYNFGLLTDEQDTQLQKAVEVISVKLG